MKQLQNQRYKLISRIDVDLSPLDEIDPHAAASGVCHRFSAYG